jgi:hypothetical protein
MARGDAKFTITAENKADAALSEAVADFSRVGRSAAQVAREFAAVRNSGGGVGSQLKRISDESKRTADALTSVKRAAVGLFAFHELKAGTLALGRQIVALERQQGALELMAGGAKGAAAEYARLLNLARTRVTFPFDELIGGFIKLKARGLDPSGRALVAYGNASVALGKSLDQMVEAVADAIAGEFERLKEFGINAKAQGDKVTFTFQGVSKTVGKNAKEIQEYLISIGEVNFAGAMEKQADKLGTAVGRMQTSWGQFVKALKDGGVGQYFRDAAEAATGFPDKLTSVLNRMSGAEGPLSDHRNSLVAVAEAYLRTGEEARKAADKMKAAQVADARRILSAKRQEFFYVRGDYEEANAGYEQRKKAFDRSGRPLPDNVREMGAKAAALKKEADALERQLAAMQQNFSELKGVTADTAKNVKETAESAGGTAKGAGETEKGMKGAADEAKRLKEELKKTLPFPVLKPVPETRQVWKTLREDAKDTADDVKGFFRDALKESAHDWEGWGDAVSDVLGKLSDKLMESAVDGAFGALFDKPSPVGPAGPMKLGNGGKSLAGSLFSGIGDVFGGDGMTFGAVDPSLPWKQGSGGMFSSLASAAKDAVSSVGSLFGGFFADGGRLGAGQWGIAGENGPEVIYGGSSGMTVIPPGRGNGSGGGARKVDINVNVSGARGNQEIMAMVQAGVAAGIRQYDRSVVSNLSAKAAREG